MLQLIRHYNNKNILNRTYRMCISSIDQNILDFFLITVLTKETFITLMIIFNIKIIYT